jgi:hypothetical protein
MLVIALLQLLERLQPPRIGGSRKGNRKNKDRNRMVGAVMLEANYFIDDPTHMGRQPFSALLDKKKGLFLKIVQCVRDYGDYFIYKRYTTLG